MNTKTKNTLITIATSLLVLLIVTTATYAIGTLTPSGTAGDATQYTLNDIYTKLTEGTATSTKTGSISVPGSVSASFRTLTEIYEAIPAELSIVASTTTVPVGINLATTTLESIDSDLAAANIAEGTTIFGIEGSLASADPGLPKSGQTTSYVANDDGAIEAGIAMSYTDNGDGTVTDNVTGLIWQQDGAYNATSWQDAISYCANNVATLPGTGWRLPNVKELQSIVDYGRVSPTINPVFTNTQSAYYWSGTTYLGSTGNAWNVYFNNGYVSYGVKSVVNYCARCVR